MTEPTREQVQRFAAQHQAMRVALLREFDRIKRPARVIEPHAGKRAGLVRISAATR